MKNVAKVARKVVVAVVAIPMFILGLVLIPLPGPGLVICFISLLLLSSEFEWARKRYEPIRAKINKILDDYKQKQKDIKEKYK